MTKHGKPRFTPKQPFAHAFQALRRDALSRPDYDPVRLFIWGQVQATALLEVLKVIEKRFGRDGQQVCTDAITEVGRRIAFEAMQGVEVPPEISEAEAHSNFATWINEQVYASVEKPSVDSEDQASFDIIWCPHQETYRPFDCRIQRYIVAGLSAGAREALGDKVGVFNAACESLIPAGAPFCHFRMWRPAAGDEDAWGRYSRELEEKALKRSQNAAKD